MIGFKEFYGLNGYIAVLNNVVIPLPRLAELDKLQRWVLRTDNAIRDIHGSM